MEKTKMCMLDYDLASRVFKRYDFQINRSAKRECLYESIKGLISSELKELQRKNAETTIGIKEARRIVRLKNASLLSETQLELEFKSFLSSKPKETKEAIKKFLESFWNLIYVEVKNHPYTDDIIQGLSSIERTQDVTSVFLGLIDSISMIEVMIENDFYFDGMPYDSVRKNFYLTSDLKELNIIASKYSVSIPKSYKKEDLKGRLIKGLESQGVSDAVSLEVIENATVKELQALLLSYGLDDSTYLVKKDVIEYLLKHAKTVSHLYVEASEEEYALIEESSKLAEAEEDNVIQESAVLKEVVRDIDYEHYLKTIISNQEKIIQFHSEQRERETRSKKEKLLDRLYSYVIFILIVFVALIWLVYVFNNFILG